MGTVMIDTSGGDGMPPQTLGHATIARRGKKARATCALEINVRTIRSRDPLRKNSFLTIFFIALGIVFAVAVWLRLRSYDETSTATQGSTLVTTGATTAALTTSAAAEPSAGTVHDPGVIVEATTGTNPTASSVAETESERERRYNELLRATPAATAPPTTYSAPNASAALPSAAESPVKRAAETPVATPRPKPSVPAPAIPLRSSPTPAPKPPETPSYPPPDNSSRDRPEDDGESDLIAPQLMSVEFIPGTVQDGESTILAVTAQDNLSGVRSVSGVISGPSGTVQGFACQREGDSARFVTRVAIPKEAAAGVWALKYLTLTDNASNSVNLNAAQGALPPTATFRVVASASDTTAPSLKSIWVDRPAMRAGDRNTVFVQAEDDKTGVAIVSGVFVSPGKQARLAFGCRPGSTGAWECPLTPPACLDCGVWHLEQLQLQDKANNMATIRADNAILSPVVVDISGDACDANPPALSMLTIEPLVVSNAEGGTLQVRATIADDGCGVASLSGQAVPQGNVGGQHAYFSMQPSGDGRTFIGTLTIEKLAAKGIWTIAWLQALDKGHNLRAYAATDPIVSRVTFRVE